MMVSRSKVGSVVSPSCEVCFNGNGAGLGQVASSLRDASIPDMQAVTDM